MFKPFQVALLANMVHRAITENPEPDQSPTDVDPDDLEPADWEKALKKMVDESQHLPNYDDLPEAEANLMDELILYYTKK